MNSGYSCSKIVFFTSTGAFSFIRCNYIFTLINPSLITFKLLYIFAIFCRSSIKCLVGLCTISAPQWRNNKIYPNFLFLLSCFLSVFIIPTTSTLNSVYAFIISISFFDRPWMFHCQKIVSFLEECSVLFRDLWLSWSGYLLSRFFFLYPGAKAMSNCKAIDSYVTLDRVPYKMWSSRPDESWFFIEVVTLHSFAKWLFHFYIFKYFFPPN